jgi:hypothetical protein
MAYVAAHGNARHADGRLTKSMSAFMNPSLRSFRSAFAGGIASLCLTLFCSSAHAHNGPPFPIITEQRVGPCIVSLWIHPDIGTSPIFILVDPAPGNSIPKDLALRVGIQPVSGRLPEVVYQTALADQRGQLEYKTDVEFDRQEFWNVRLILTSSAGGGESLAKVEATPIGYGRWDLLLFALPFAAVGFLWFKVATKRRQQRKQRLAQASLAATPLP